MRALLGRNVLLGKRRPRLEVHASTPPAAPTPASPDPNITNPFAGQKKDLDDLPLGEDDDFDFDDDGDFDGDGADGGEF